jgi:tetratricopeptide (TPR) repeat protein
MRMSTETGVAARAESKNMPPRQLWQVPTFFVGLLALLAVGALHSLSSRHGLQRQVDRDLAASRQALDESPPAAERARSLAEHVLTLVPADSPTAGEAHFLIGSACLRQAEHAPAEARALLWQQAREHLEQADALGTPDADRPRLAYRLGKTYDASNVGPQRVIDCLSWSVAEGTDNPFEGYALLAQAYLHLPEPNLRGALDATRKQLALPNADDAMLAPVRLLCGELLCKLDQPEEARQVLARVGAGTPPDLLLRARLLRARLLQDEGAWADAARAWEEVKGDPRWTAAEPGRVLYSLGLCYRKLDQISLATENWEACVVRGGDEGQAAALDLAEVRLRGEHPTLALDVFAAALRGVTAPSDYHNSFIEISEARNRLEAGCELYRQIGAYDQARQLARLYERLALPGVGQQLAGQAAEGWARSLLEQAAAALTAEATRRDREEARQRFHEAGVAYEKAADLASSPTEQADWLWHSANDYFEGQDPDRAVAVLERFVPLQPAHERQGQAWFLLGEAHRLLRNDVAAQAAYQKCIEYPGLSANWARLQLARTSIEQKNWDDAEKELADNLRLAPPGSEPHEKSLITLANLLFQRRKYSEAFRALDQALRTYPANPTAPRLRLEFAQCCRQLAEQVSEYLSITDYSTPEARAHYRAERSKLVEQAAAQYQKLADDLEGIRVNRTLAPEEETILCQAHFAFAECRFDLGKFEEALRLYNALAERYRHRLGELTALRHIWQCHGVLFQPEQVRTTLARLRVALNEMPNTAFDGSTDEATRAWWESWLIEKSKLRDVARPANGKP